MSAMPDVTDNSASYKENDMFAGSDGDDDDE